jgi:N-acetylglucosaminyldiphosphoundecaprenol N-acetyl-beta-D-mannosaminyltransferase
VTTIITSSYTPTAPSARDRDLRILVIANLYPSHEYPAFGTFVRTRVQGLRKAGVQVSVAANRQPVGHGRWILKYSRLAIRALAAAVRARVSRRPFDVVEAHIAFPTGLIALVASAIGGGRLVLFAHGSDVREVAWRSRLTLGVARFLFRRADAVIANSAFTASQVVRLGPLKREPLVLSPGIVLPRLSTSQPAQRIGVLFVGRLTPDKGVRELLEAFSEIRDSELPALTVVGSGPQRAELETLAQRLRIRVAFLGPVSHPDVADLMAQAAIVVMPSVYEEPLGLVALEGMAHGAIVVATRTGGLAETIVDGENGFAVPPGDVSALASAIKRALALAPSEADRLRKAGYDTAARHAIERTVEMSIEYYKRLTPVMGGVRPVRDAFELAGRSLGRIHVGGVPVDDLTMDETLSLVDSFVASGKPHRHVAINVSKVVQASRSLQLKQIIAESDVLTADGLPIVWASRLLGTPLRERVTGVDLMQRLIAHSAVRGYRLYFLGANQLVVAEVVRRAANEHPGVEIAGWRDGYWQADEEATVVRGVAATRPDIVFVAMGSPRKEEFLARWKEDLEASFAMGVGGSFDVYAGYVRRAPRLMQRFGLEWLFRVSQEPRRLVRRYASDAPRFAAIVLREFTRSKK